MKIAVIGPVILAVLLGVAGCGQRGPLVLPKPAGADASASQKAPQERR
jgi:predicted small lipoprotein YifL